MTDTKKGLPRPRPPVDLFTLQPEEDLIPEATEKQETEVETTSSERDVPVSETSQQQEVANEAGKDEELPQRYKTSVELTPEALELISQLKAQHRIEHRRHLALWRILDEAVKLYARQELENTELPISVNR
jgi:hypothetical protein